MAAPLAQPPGTTRRWLADRRRRHVATAHRNGPSSRMSTLLAPGPTQAPQQRRRSHRARGRGTGRAAADRPNVGLDDDGDDGEADFQAVMAAQEWEAAVGRRHHVVASASAQRGRSQCTCPPTPVPRVVAPAGGSGRQRAVAVQAQRQRGRPVAQPPAQLYLCRAPTADAGARAAPARRVPAVQQGALRQRQVRWAFGTAPQRGG